LLPGFRLEKIGADHDRSVTAALQGVTPIAAPFLIDTVSAILMIGVGNHPP
jgi:hypothetical protein